MNRCSGPSGLVYTSLSSILASRSALSIGRERNPYALSEKYRPTHRPMPTAISEWIRRVRSSTRCSKKDIFGVDSSSTLAGLRSGWLGVAIERFLYGLGGLCGLNRRLRRRVGTRAGRAIGQRSGLFGRIERLARLGFQLT